MAYLASVKQSLFVRRTTTLIGAAVLIAVLFPSPAEAGRTVTIKGGGWGHGIGMSQYGAYGRALNGRSAAEILEHYYSGASVRTRTMPEKIRVGLLQERNSLSLTSKPFKSGIGKVKFYIQDGMDPVARGDSSDGFRVEVSSTGGLRLFKNGNRVKKDGKSVFGGPSRPLMMKFQPFDSIVHVESRYDYAYGKLSFGTYSTASCGSNYCQRVVLSLPMQKYLFGLGEVPSSWPDASLKSQAIAARTYAFKKVEEQGQHRYPCDCAVFDTPVDQAYIGDAKRTGSGEYWDDWKSAVTDSKDRVIIANGSPIDALYSSSSGGHTENNENVWGGEALSFLRGVKDGPDSVDANPNHKWKVTMSWRDFSDRLNSYFGTGDLDRFKIVEPLGVSGRVTVVKSSDRGGVKIVGSRKTIRADGWDVRSALGLKDTLFTVTVSQNVATRLEGKYERLDGAPGRPGGDAYGVPRRGSSRLGIAQDFAAGRMTLRHDTGEVLWQHGPVLRRYDDAGREQSVLGMPASDVRGAKGSAVGFYDNGIIVWSPDTGAQMVRGGFASAYRRNGSLNGPLGLPVSERERGADLQRFENGGLYRDGAGNVYGLWGRIAATYAAVGEAGSACGSPVADALGTGSHLEAAFENGSMVWDRGAGVTITCP